MIDITLCIIACALLVLGFKIFQKLGISAFQAIVINYGVAGLLGFILVEGSTNLNNAISSKWFVNACVLGFVFIFNFYILALSAQKLGASVTSVASKMSLVVTILFGVLYFGDVITPVKLIGIVLALGSIFLITQIRKQSDAGRYLWLPIVLFLGGGFIDIFLNFNQTVHFPNGGVALFSTYLFSSAFIFGLVTIIPRIVLKKEQFNLKSVIGGVLLGLVNWYSIFFLMASLKTPGWDSSTVYTVVNIGIVVVSVIAGVIVFREKLSRLQWLGIVIALIAITLISVPW